MSGFAEKFPEALPAAKQSRPDSAHRDTECRRGFFVGEPRPDAERNDILLALRKVSKGDKDLAHLLFVCQPVPEVAPIIEGFGR